METLLTALYHTWNIFLVLSVYYFFPASICYYIFYIKKKEEWRHMKIQQKYPKPSQLKREIISSTRSLFIFSLVGLLIYESAIRGYTKIYFNIGDHSLLYFFCSLLFYIFLNDTIFYWTHRFMHLKSIFRYVHLEHHTFTCPTQFASFAFHPIEAFIHAAVYPLLVFTVPIHPVMFTAFMIYNLIANLAGHGGYEFIPEKVTKHWFFNWQTQLPIMMYTTKNSIAILVIILFCGIN